MKTISKIVALSFCLIAPAAFAQPAADKKPAAPPADAAKKAEAPAAPAMLVPVRPAELDQLNSMVGTWKCEGKSVMGGKEMAMKSTAKFAWDLDKNWVKAEMSSPKTKDMPAFKGTGFYGYDAANKQFVSYHFDNLGGSGMSTSKGKNGTTWEWAGKMSMMGQSMDVKSSINEVSAKEVTIKSSMGPGMTDEMTCKK
jgi:hypothetical protein